MPQPDEVFPDGSTPATQPDHNQPPKPPEQLHRVLAQQAQAGMQVEQAAQPSDQPQVMAIHASRVQDPWLCPNGHLLGCVKHEKRNGGRVARLLLLRKAFTAQDLIPEPMFFAVVDAAVVGCSICGETREWRPGADFIERMEKRNRH